jgi:soluble lytic murein transglycosylase-like protein
MSEQAPANKLGEVAVSNDETFFTKLKRRTRFGTNSLIWMLAGALIAIATFIIITVIQHAQVPLRPQTTTLDSPWIPATVKHWQPQIDAMSKKYNIDPTFLAIIMTLESGGDPKANSGQAQGLMQITPVTAKDIASRYLKKPVSTYDLYDPDTSIEFGAAYLSLLRDTFGDYTQAPTYNLTAEAVGAGYNGGPGAANDLLNGKGNVDEQTVVYSRNVFYFWRERQAAKSPAYLRWRDEAGGIRLIQAAEKYQKETR